MRKLLSVLALFGLGVCMLTFPACGVSEEKLRAYFPMWEEAQGELSELPISPSIELEFQGINFEAYSSDEGEMYDEVLVHFVNRGERGFDRTDSFGVFYLYNDKWYTVYYLSTRKSLLAMESDKGYAAHSEEDMSFLVPSGLFSIPGEYKLWYSHMGFCDIDIVFVPE